MVEDFLSLEFIVVKNVPFISYQFFRRLNKNKLFSVNSQINAKVLTQKLFRYFQTPFIGILTSKTHIILFYINNSNNNN